MFYKARRTFPVHAELGLIKDGEPFAGFLHEGDLVQVEDIHRDRRLSLLLDPVEDPPEDPPPPAPEPEPETPEPQPEPQPDPRPRRRSQPAEAQAKADPE